MDVYCRKCGTKNKDTLKFCPQCGAELMLTHPQTGKLTITWQGMWMLIDAKIHLWINENKIGEYSFKKGFEVIVPITSSRILIGVKCSIRSYQPVLNVNPIEDYTLHIIYSRFIGGFDFVLCDKYGKRVM